MPPRNFHEAVQSLWFTFAFLKLCGNWPGIGCIDYLLGDYLKNDLKLLKRVAEVMRYGGGILAFYNEDLVISALVKDGYDEREVRKFANDGCWEVQISG